MKNLQHAIDTLPISRQRPDIGSVTVIKGEPENENPFRAVIKGNSVIGEERKRALYSFRDTGEKGPYTFWDMRNSAHVIERRIENPDRINWGI